MANSPRAKLWYNASDGTFIAQTAKPIHGTIDDWADVSASYRHQIYALMDGQFIGAGMQPDDICKKGTEHGHQAALFAWVAAITNVGITKDLAKLYAIPNGGKRDATTAAMLKSEGVRKGVPDLFLPVPILVMPRTQTMLQAVFGETILTNNVLSGLYIEMKKPNEGRVSPEQVERIDQLRKDGYAVVVCRSWRQARDSLVTYLDLNHAVEDFLRAQGV